MVSIEPVSLALKSKIMKASHGPATHVLSQCSRSTQFDAWIEEFARSAVQPMVRARAFRWLFARRVTWVIGHQRKWLDRVYGKSKFEPVLASREISVELPFSLILDAAFADRSAFVRYVAAEFLMRELHTLGAAALPLAQCTSLDSNSKVAERGRFMLKQLDALSD
jgi:hypothetical protein